MNEPLPEIAVLHGLHEIDIEIESINKRKQKLAGKERQRKLLEALGKVEAVSEKGDQELGVAGAGQKKLEDQIAILDQRLRSDEKSLYDGSISNAKELKALQDDMVTRGRHKDQLETKLLEIMEEVGELDGRRRDVEKLRSKLEHELAATEKESAIRLAEVEEQLRLALSGRQELTAKLEPERLRVYEALRKSKGVAVGILKDGVCGSCGIGASTGQMQKVCTGPPPWECPNCHRLLIPSIVKDPA